MKMIISIMISLMLFGCSPARKTLIGISQEEVLNNNAVRKAALNWLEIWPMQSGFIYAWLSHEDLPQKVVAAIDEILFPSKWDFSLISVRRGS